MSSKTAIKKTSASKTVGGSKPPPSAGASLRVGIKQLEHADGLPLPAYQSPAAAGLDLVAAVAENKPIAIRPGQRALVATGLVMEIPEGFEAQVRPRSGLALKFGVTVLNTPGTIDADYRGEVGVILYNAGAETFRVARGDRIAQLVIAPVTQAVLVAADTVSETDRGTGGFGSTGPSAKPPKGSAPAKKAKRSARTDAAGKTSAKSAASAKKTKAKSKSGRTSGRSRKSSRKLN